MNPDPLQLRTRLGLPLQGGSARLAVGACELVFEAVRGGYTLLWHAGREARRYVVGLPDGGETILELRPPSHRVRLLLKETLALAPGARVYGYVQVPLVPTLLWRDDAEAESQLIELMPASLAAEWHEGTGTSFTCTSTWLVRFPVHGGEARATVPLRLHNASPNALSPEDLPLRLRVNELREMRGGIIALPRRLTWDGDSWQQHVAAAHEVPA